MAMFAAAAGASAAGSLIGGMQAAKASKAAREQAADFTNKAIAALEKVGVPTVEAQKIALENPKMVFQYAPELEKEFPELKTQYDQIETDPRLAAAQNEALMGMQERANEGLTAQEQADINALRRGTAQQENARQGSILQNMEQRGMGGSGAELLSRIASSQQAAQQAGVASESEAAQIAQRKLEALAQLGSMASSQQAQSFGQQAQKASASDTIAQLNQAARYNVQGTNVANLNQAALDKAKLQQELEGVRANTANTQEQYNKGLVQQKFQNDMSKAGAAANAYTGAANNATQAGATQAANTMAMWQGIGNAGMGGANAYAASKKDIKDTTTKPKADNSSGDFGG
jgi:hypothetical protein